MGFFWIAGLPGSGKSTIVRALQERGFEAHDGDDLSAWFERESGQPVADLPVAERPSDWFQRVGIYIDVERLKDLRLRARDHHIFVCGCMTNELEVWPLFDRHAYLALDDQTLTRRIKARVNHQFGNGPGELEAILRWNATAEEEYRALDAKVVNSGRPVDDVVQSVLGATVGSPSPRTQPDTSPSSSNDLAS